MSWLDFLGLRPDGDPEGMRLYASSLRASAEMIRAAGHGAAESVHAATFVGPAGDATRARADRLRGRASQRADELRNLADAIDRAAGEVEDDQRNWEVLKDRFWDAMPG